MEELKTYRLADICNSIQTGPFGSQLHKSDYVEFGTPIVMPKDITNGKINDNNISRISKNDVARLFKHKLVPGNIIYPRRGDISKCALITSKEDGWVCGTGCIKVDINQQIANSTYVMYVLCQSETVNWIESNAVGTTMLNLNTSILSDLPIKLPSLNTQKKLANIVSSFDKKIALNRRINDNLEQQAQALFKSWFVEKPNPQWTKGSLSDIASFVGGYSYKGDELVDSSNTGMATIKNYNRSGGFKTDGFKAINPSDKVKNAQYAELFEILVAHTDLTQNAEVIGNAELVLSLGEYNKIIFSMDLVKVLPSSSFPYRFLIAAMLKNKLFKGHCQGYVNGTTVLHLNKKALPEYKVMIPTDTEAKKMNEILGGYYKRMSENLKESDMLEQLRDTILPKLMSGELKINDLNC